MDSIPPIPPGNENPQQEVVFGLRKVWSGIKKFWYELTDLKKGLDREGTIINIRTNMRIQGANAWTLMCSIMIASLGLDLNSPAVIIGAMLISPLMAPILGVGLSIGINDYNSLRISFKHFGVAIAIALVTSTFYFLLTPFGDFTDEIRNRTAPTFLDAAVALFGGIAGIISGSQKDKSNAIPGVAIATALMPPLCVSGFGIANLIKYGTDTDGFSSITRLNNFEITLNSFYLFFLNATLVAMATFLIVRLLRFPLRSYSDKRDAQKTNLIIGAVSILIIIPSFFILRSVLREVNTQNSVQNAINQSFGNELQFVDDWKIYHSDSTDMLLIKVYSTTLNEKMEYYRENLVEKLPEMKIALLPSAEVDLDNFQKVASQASEVARLDSLVTRLSNQSVKKKTAEILKLEASLDSMMQDTSLMVSVKKEVISLFPEKVTDVLYFHPSPASKNPPTVVINWKYRKDPAIQQKIVNFIITRTGVKEVIVANQ